VSIDQDNLGISFLADDYFEANGRVEFVQFAGRMAALVWLHRSMSATLVEGVSGLRALEASGKHRDPAFWGHGDRDSNSVGPAEYDLVLGESLGVLQQDATPMCGGVIILSGTAALESLMTDLLDQPQDSSIRKAGLRRKTAELRRRWEGYIDGDALAENVEWLAERRNAFAHNLIDGDGDWPRSLAPGRFNADAVEEALHIIGDAAHILQSGWEQHLSAQGR
jgi:hypothetical protein